MTVSWHTPGFRRVLLGRRTRARKLAAPGYMKFGLFMRSRCGLYHPTVVAPGFQGFRAVPPEFQSQQEAADLKGLGGKGCGVGKPAALNEAARNH